MLRQKQSENLIYILLWSMVITLPVFTLKGGDEFNMNRLVFEWIRLLPFFIIFIINNSILSPQLLLKRKITLYLIAVSAIVLAFSIFNDFPHFIHDLIFQGSGEDNMLMNHPNIMNQGDPLGGLQQNLGNRPPMPGGQKGMGFLIFENMIISFLVVGFNNAIKLGVLRQKDVLQQEEKEKIHLKTELSFLRQQISPHFFMNTLNNIHALVELDQIQAQKSIIELSHLMRYLLNESQKGIASIKDEFDFLNSYIGLMRIRYSDKVKIDINIDLSDDHKKIPPLLFVSLVENAFKYGVSYSQNSYITINAKQEKDELSFEIKNSISNNKEKGTGLGLINLKKQLEILFKGTESLEIIEDEKTFFVKLIIPLEDD